MDLGELRAPVAGESGIDDALASWRWLVRSAGTPLVATALGDVFIRSEAGAVSFLDILAGTYAQVADSVVAWEALLRAPEFVDKHFSPAFVMQLRETAVLAQGECTSQSRIFQTEHRLRSGSPPNCRLVR
jgi:hypothetical protein